MPLDREKAREAIKAYETGEVASLHPGHPDDWLDDLLDALEACVTPRLAEIDVRLVEAAEAKLARIRTVCDQQQRARETWHVGHISDAADVPSPVETAVRAILDARP